MSDLDQRRIAALGAKPALVVVDVQRSFADPTHLAAQGADTDTIASIEAATARIASMVVVCRDLGVPVVWVELVSDPQHPWRASGWLHAGDPDAAYDEFQPCVAGTPGAQWFRMSPLPGEIRVVKRGYSGFLGTDLADQLRDAGIDWLAITGLTTECCVDATATDAFQLEWPVCVPRDATAANTAELHENALVQLGLNAAVVSSADAVLALFRDRASAA